MLSVDEDTLDHDMESKIESPYSPSKLSSNKSLREEIDITPK